MRLSGQGLMSHASTTTISRFFVKSRGKALSTIWFGLSTAEFILQRGLHTVFAETSVNPKSIEALQEAVAQKGGAVRIGLPLYSDALGNEGTKEATLIGAFRYNALQILTSFE